MTPDDEIATLRARVDELQAIADNRADTIAAHEGAIQRLQLANLGLETQYQNLRSDLLSAIARNPE